MSPLPKILVAVALALGLAALGFTLAQEVWDAEKIAPFYPTPMAVAEKMLEAGELKPGELLYDLGSGDGRIVILAAHKFGARAVGFEIDIDLIRRSRARIAELGLTENARIEKKDLLRANFSQPDLVTVYLLPGANDRIRPLLENQLRRGARVVSHDFAFEGWTPEKTVNILDSSEWERDEHKIYLYRR